MEQQQQQQQLNYLERIAENTRTKTNINLLVSGNTSTINTTYNPPIVLDLKRKYEIALTSLDTYYSFPNIDDSNDTFKYKQTDGGVGGWKSIKIPTGCYEITAINKEIQKKIGGIKTAAIITIKANLNTLKCMLVIKSGYVVDFNVANSLATVLGFNKILYQAGSHSSEHIVNILRINSILVNLDIVTNSYIKGVMSPTIYNFFPNVSPGVKIVSIPKNLVYLPVTVNTIYCMKVWLTDQDNRPLDLQGEEVTIRFHLREC